MSKLKSTFFILLILTLVAFCGSVGSSAQSTRKPSISSTPAPSAECAAGQMRCISQAQRQEAAHRAARARALTAPANNLSRPASRLASPMGVTPALGAAPAALTGPYFPLLVGCGIPTMNPGGQPDYMSGCTNNYANSPLPVTDPITGAYISGGLRKFIDPLPNLNVAIPDKTTYPGSDYYEISLVEYTQQMHSDLPNPTLLRGYVQTNAPTAQTPSYLGPLIIAQRNVPVRVKFTNKLPATGTPDSFGQDGNLFIPVDTTVMGSGMAPNGTNYSQNRSGIHLHGGNTPWISDGTPHQWTTPAGETTAYPKGVSVRDVPDMPASGPGEMTFYYTNQQSARLMFYHDHAYGITRLNVYAGVAAGYLLQDPVEQAMVNGGVITPPVGVPVTVPAGTIPADQIPIVIQDKTFVPGPDQLAAQDPTWNWGPKDVNGNFLEGNLWFPHVYMPNQNPSDDSGVNAMGRWDWGPWFWPAMDPSTLKSGESLCPTAANPAQMCPGTPNPSLTPESFMDTPVVNGMAYPYVTVDPKAYRLRILNAANDRFLNLSLYQAFDKTGLLPSTGDGTFTADPAALVPTCTTPSATVAPGVPQSCTEVRFVPPPDGIASQGPIPDPLTKGPNMIEIGTEGGFLPAPVTLTNTPIGYNYNRRDIVVLNVAQKNLWLGPADRADVIVDFSAFAGKTLILYNDSGAPVPAFDPRIDYYTGDPDQTTTGGAPSTLPGFGPNMRTIMQIRVNAGTPQPYNPTALIADLPVAYAASQDAPIIPETAYGPAYNATFPNAYARIQDTSLFTGKINGLTIMNAGSGYVTAPTVTITAPACTPSATCVKATATATIVGGKVTAFTMTNVGAGYSANPVVTISAPPVGVGHVTAVAAAVGIPMLRKTIQELFELDYGRMNATLGTEGQFTNFNTQTTIPLGYIDPPTENFGDGETQIWKITHNGVDSHAIHFHLFNVQLINRVGWDGAVRPPFPDELGWKETVIMSPLEDAIVALRPVKQNLPWPLADSVRLQDVTALPGASIRVVDSISGNATNVTNANINFGQEYVWHCHLLGHEENDMMRPMIFQVPPEAPSNMFAFGSNTSPNVTLAFQDNSLSETGFVVQRTTDPQFLTGITNLPVTIPAFPGFGTTVKVNDLPPTGTTVFYRAAAINSSAFNGYTAAGTMLTKTLTSPFTSIVSVTYPPAAKLAPLTQSFSYQLLNTTSTAKTITLSNTGQGVLTNIVIGFAGVNASEFTQTTNCTSTLAIGASCSINVSFRPTAIGTRNATVTVASNDPVNPVVSAALTGIGAAAMITSPVPGSTLAGTSATFTWTGAPGVTSYYLWVGTAGVGSRDIMNFGATSATSLNVFGLPTTGKTVYVRLQAVYNGVTQSMDYTYVAASSGTQVTPVAAQLVSPASGTIISGGGATFTWNTGTAVSGYFLWIGRTLGARDLYSSPITTSLSVSVTGLPTNGSTVYVRLYSVLGNSTISRDYTFVTATAAPNGLQITSPVPGSVLTGPSATFQWNPVPGATGYYLWVGTGGPGTRNILNFGVTTVTSLTVFGLPTNGSTIYVRFQATVNGVTQSVDYTYTASNSGTVSAPPVNAQLLTPATGTVLRGGTTTFTWGPGTSVSGYFIWVGTTLGSRNIYSSAISTNQSAVVSQIPTSGATVYVRLFSIIGASQSFNDYTYTTGP